MPKVIKNWPKFHGVIQKIKVALFETRWILHICKKQTLINRSINVKFAKLPE